MSNEWRDLKTLQDLAAAQAAGDEIQILNCESEWEAWIGNLWAASWQYRARPRQPVTKKVKVLCWLINNHLHWYASDVKECPHWVRVPSEDKEIEVEE